MSQPDAPLFCFTLDTEADDLWADRPQLTFDHFQRLFDFHRRLRRAGAKPVYLTTSEVAEHPEARRALQRCLDDGGCEIGAHFHSWTRDWPFPVPDLGQPRCHAMAHQLGQPLEERMLDFTCRALKQAFSVEARSYRGGRWSLSASSILSLRNCGIEVDSTVTPGMNWRDTRHPMLDGPDYRTAKRSPQSLPEVFGESPDPSAPLEIPVGAAWFPSIAGRGGPFIVRQFSRLGRLTGLRWAIVGCCPPAPHLPIWWLL
jgi:hypothetical protein